MVLEDVKALRDKLRMLDWSIPPEERTVNAAGLNQVRYADLPDDRRVAELLAVGRSEVRAVKPLSS